MKAWSTNTGEKAACREVFINAIGTHSGSPTEFFVLPSDDALDVELLKAKWPQSRIRGVERSINVFEHIQRTHFGVIVERMTVGQFVDREVSHPSGTAFDAAFLDYTGICTSENVKDVCGFVNHLAKPQFVLGLTFQKSTRGKKDDARHIVMNHSWIDGDDLDRIEDVDGPEWNTSGYVADAVCGAIENGYGGFPALQPNLHRLDILDHRTYQAGERTTPMHFMVLLIERN